MNRPTCFGKYPWLGIKCLECRYEEGCIEKMSAQVEQAVKQDDKKPTPELLPFAALVEVSEVLAYGARKYAPGNWRKGLLWSRLLGAALRHLFAWGAGEAKDPETGRNHLAHAACCILFLLEYEQVGGYAHLDDRWKGRQG